MRKVLISIGLFLLAVGMAHGQGLPVNGESIKSTAGQSASVRVCTKEAISTPCTILASIYKDELLTIPADNPLATDAQGNYSYYVTPGVYKEQITGNGVTKTRMVTIGPEDSKLVHKTGDETIQGSKKFTYPGAFTNDAMHEGIKVEVNGLTAAGEFHGHLFKNDYATEGISAAIAVPADATNETSNAISGYVTNDAGQATSAIAVTGMARSTSVDARVWGGVFVTTDGPAGLKSNSLYGTENDVNVNNADSVPHGLLVNGYWHAQPTDGAALEVQQPIGDVPGGAHWPHGLRFQRGATPPPDPNYAALYLEQQDSGNNQPSQGATLVSTSDAGVGNTGHFWLDPDGSFKFHLPTAGAYFKVDTGGFFQQNGGSSLLPSVLNNAVGVQGDVKHTLGSGVDATYGVIGAAKATAEAEGDRAYGGWFKSSSTNTLTAQVAVHAEVVDASSSTTLIEGVAGGAQKFSVDGTGKITTSSNGLVTNLNADTVDGKHAADFAPSTIISGTPTVNRAVCWKTASTLGYCSTAPDASGACTCN